MTDHQVHIRWADLDQLRHVNNARYLEYSEESKAQLVDGGELSADRPIAEIELEYFRPLYLSRTPLTITNDLSEERLTQEVWLESAGERHLHARITTQFGHGDPSTVAPADASRDMFGLRRDDFGSRGVVRTSRIFELLQEARILQMDRLRARGWSARMVVARFAVTIGRPIGEQDAVEATTWIFRVGNASFGFDVILAGPDGVHARGRAAMVGFDDELQRSRPFSEPDRALLLDVLLPDSAVSI